MDQGQQCLTLIGLKRSFLPLRFCCPLFLCTLNTNIPLVFNWWYHLLPSCRNICISWKCKAFSGCQKSSIFVHLEIRPSDRRPRRATSESLAIHGASNPPVSWKCKHFQDTENLRFSRVWLAVSDFSWRMLLKFYSKLAAAKPSGNKFGFWHFESITTKMFINARAYQRIYGK